MRNGELVGRVAKNVELPFQARPNPSFSRPGLVVTFFWGVYSTLPEAAQKCSTFEMKVHRKYGGRGSVVYDVGEVVVDWL